MAFSWNFQSFVTWLNSMGLLDIILPFLLIFTLIFAVLENTKIFGENKKHIHTILGIIIGLVVVLPHTIGGYQTIGFDPVTIINGALPAIAVVIVAVIMLLILIGVWGGRAKWTAGSLATWIFVLSLIVVIWAFGAAAGRLPGWDWLMANVGEEVVSFAIIVIVFALIIAFITAKDEGKEKASKLASFGQSIGDFFGGGKK